jgi:hypothetical protein
MGAPASAAMTPTVATTGPGVICPSATALRNWGLVIQWYVWTASACISGMITNPPPNESAPTLNAVHASAPIPPVLIDAGAITASGPWLALGLGHPCRMSSLASPQASSARTRYAPISAAAAVPTAR